jgi:chloramphenicol 3-O-phosphotransferase
MEFPTAMPRSQTDITCDKAWIDEQAARLEGFEVLRNLVKVRLVHETKPARLADKLGRDKGFIHQMLNRIKERL